MKFFTKEWATGELTDEEFDAAPSAYAQYVGSLDLPSDVLALDHTDLHDGVLERTEADTGSVEVVFITGDQQQGYFDTIIKYVVQNSEIVESALSRFRDDDVELLYAEVDRLESSYSHRMLFSTYEQVEIAFDSVVVRQSPRATRAGSR